MTTFYEEVKQYVGFSTRDSELLRSFLPVVKPHLPRIIDHFYDTLARNPGALAAFHQGTGLP